MPGNLLEAILNCGCCGPGQLCRCDGRCDPLVADTVNLVEIPNPACDDHLPVELGCDISATSNQGGICFNGSGTITYKTPLTGGVNCWEGVITGTCTDCNGVFRTWSINLTMCCVNETGNLYGVSMEAGTPGVIPVEENYVAVSAASCAPFLLAGCIPGDINGFVVACIFSMPPTQQVFSDVCFQIYEIP